MECDNCGATWQVEYGVTKIDNILVPDQRPATKKSAIAEAEDFAI